jgi:hypothetical protein
MAAGGAYSCFERGHQTGSVQSEEEEKQAAGMAAQEEPIGVLEVFSVVPGYRACVRCVRFVVRSIEGYSLSWGLDP